MVDFYNLKQSGKLVLLSGLSAPEENKAPEPDRFVNNFY